MSNQMSEGDFDSIIENELVEASEDEMDALEILTSRVSLVRTPRTKLRPSRSQWPDC